MKGGIGSAIVEIVGAVFGLVGKLTQRTPPKRATDIFHANPSESERIYEARRAEGMSTVYRSEPPPRGANAVREDLP